MTAGAWVGQAVDHPIVTLSSHLRGGFPAKFSTSLSVYVEEVPKVPAPGEVDARNVINLSQPHPRSVDRDGLKQIRPQRVELSCCDRQTDTQTK